MLSGVRFPGEPPFFQYKYADVAELADALDLGSSVYDVQVRFLSSAPNCGNSSVVECYLAKVDVASPNLVSRSKHAGVA